MLPGKKLTPDTLLEIAWRRKWLFAVPAVVAAIATAFVAASLPNVYQADALIQVVPARVPDRFVQDTVEAAADERVQTISQQVLTRARLERIVDEFNLYPEQRKNGIMQDVVDGMRARDVIVDIPRLGRRGRRGDPTLTFRVGYRGDSPRTSVRVTERLASLFIEEGLRDRSTLAEGTDRFLQAQLEESRRQLVEMEQKIANFNRQNAGVLPTQVGSNLSLMQTAQTQLQTVSDSLIRDRDQRSLLERLLAEAAAAPPPVTPQPARDAQAPQTAAAQLEAARNALSMMKLRLKPEHPDIVRAERAVKELEAKAAAEALAQPLSTGSAGPTVAADPARQARVEDLRRQIGALDVQIASKMREQERLRTLLGTYQARVEAAPTKESEFVSLTRDYETLKGRYNQLLSKREDARIAADLERREIGEQFRLIEPPRTPERPVSPDRPRIILLGTLAGLALGAALAALLEYRDTSFRRPDDVVTTLALPVLAIVPRIRTRSELKRERRWRLVKALAVLVVLVAAGAAATLVWRAGM